MPYVMVVEDSEDLAIAAAAALREDGHEVAIRLDTASALADMLKKPPELVVLDVMFPGDDFAGLELARTMNKTPLLQKIPILMMTGMNKELGLGVTPLDIDNSWLPVTDFMDKPIDYEKLPGKVRAMLSKPANGGSSMNKEQKVLIADDEPDCVAFVRRILEDSNCDVIEAPDGEKALQLARQHRPQLIILDVQMPRIDGFGVFQALRSDKELASIPIIMLTSINRISGLKFSAADMGEYYGHKEPEAFIDKPIEPAALAQAVARLLKNHTAAA